MRIELRKKRFQWYYVLLSGNNKVIVTSETFFQKGNAVRAAWMLKELINQVKATDKVTIEEKETK